MQLRAENQLHFEFPPLESGDIDGYRRMGSLGTLVNSIEGVVFYLWKLRDCRRLGVRWEDAMLNWSFLISSDVALNRTALD